MCYHFPRTSVSVLLVSLKKRKHKYDVVVEMVGDVILRISFNFFVRRDAYKCILMNLFSCKNYNFVR